MFQSTVAMTQKDSPFKHLFDSGEQIVIESFGHFQLSCEALVISHKALSIGCPAADNFVGLLCGGKWTASFVNIQKRKWPRST